MTQPAIQTSVGVRRPGGALARFVSHYWLSLDSRASTYTALPDGCLDLVLEVDGSGCQSWVYGTTTLPTDIRCSPGRHYLGVRFKPGQSRHFIRAAADELTDSRADLDALIRFPADTIGAHITSGELFAHLDRALSALLRKSPPEASYVDHVVQHIESARGQVRIKEVAARVGKSPRQLERSFRETVGVSSKLYSMITRLRHAADLIASPAPRTLSAIAMDAGYSDQSHMSHDFVRLAGVSPGELLRDDVVFFQYHASR